MKIFFTIIILFFVSSTQVYAINYNQFDLNDINTANIAVKTYHEEFKDKRLTEEADDEYEKFFNFYLEFCDIQSKKILLPNTTKNSSIIKQEKIYSKLYYQYGLIAQFDEGEYFLVPTRRYLFEQFKDYVSSPKQELLKFNVQFDKRIMYDARYTVSKSELKKYKKFYEKFNKKYPEYSKKHKIQEFIKYYEEQLKKYPNII